MRALRRLAAALCALLASTAQAETFTVDHLLRLEGSGPAAFSPDGRWLILQTFASQEATGLYDDYADYRRRQGRLLVVDLRRPGPATPLLPIEPGIGYTSGPISPSGATMLVGRLRGARWQAGLVDLASRRVRWLDLAVDLPLWGRSAAWRGSHELIAITAPLDQPSGWLRAGGAVQAALASRWAMAARGEEAATMIGSGRFLSRGGPAPPKALVAIDARTGAVRRLASGDYYDLELSPNGRLAAAARLGADIQPRPGDKIIGASATRERRLDLVDLDSGKAVEPCRTCDITSHLLAWSPDSAGLLVFARAPGAAWTTGRLIRIDAARAKAEPLTATPAIGYSGEGLEVVQAGWLGSRPWTWAQTPTGPAWRAADGPADGSPEFAQAARLIQVPAGLAMIDGEDLSLRGRGGRRDLGAWRPLVFADFGEGSRLALTRLTQAKDLWVRRGGAVGRIGPDGQIVDEAALRPEDEVLAARPGALLALRRDEHGASTLVLRLAGRDLVIARLNGFLDSLSLAKAHPIAHRRPDGSPRTSWVLTPPGWKPGQRPPIVALPYPGWVYGASPPAALRADAALFHHNAQVIAAQGYAVLLPSLPHDEAALEPSQGLAGDILAAVDAAGAAGLGDPRRVALWGQSFGGYGALMAASQSDRFAAVVATAAATDLSFAHGRATPLGRVFPEDGLTFVASMGWTENGQAALGLPPWRAPDRYWRNSPRFQVRAITAPVLLAYGDLDVVGMDEGEAMFSALYREGKDARLLTLWGEGHVILGPGNVRRLYREAFAFLGAAFDPLRKASVAGGGLAP